MTCKDCIHYVWCKDTIADENWTDEAPKEIKEMFSPKGCENFKNKVNFVEVVRCKDCRHCELRYPAKAIGEEAIEEYYCHPNQRYARPNDFCSYGERKG